MFRPKVATIALMAFGTLSLSACTGTKKNPVAETDPVVLELKKLASEIKQASVKNKELLQDRAINTENPVYTHSDLAQTVSVLDYAGDAENILRKLSTNIDWRFRSVGRNIFPVTVVVSADNAPIVEVLREIGAQLGRDVAVVADEAKEEIRLEYY